MAAVSQAGALPVVVARCHLPSSSIVTSVVRDLTAAANRTEPAIHHDTVHHHPGSEKRRENPCPP
jgi:hypothetical protein